MSTTVEISSVDTAMTSLSASWFVFWIIVPLLTGIFGLTTLNKLPYRIWVGISIASASIIASSWLDFFVSRLSGSALDSLDAYSSHAILICANVITVVLGIFIFSIMASTPSMARGLARLIARLAAYVRHLHDAFLGVSDKEVTVR